MDFDWINPAFDLKGPLLPSEIEESFEDPFSLRLVGSDENPAVQSRFFCLGKTAGGKAVFIIYRSDGKKIRVIAARPMTEGEEYFYERKITEELSR